MELEIQEKLRAEFTEKRPQYDELRRCLLREVKHILESARITAYELTSRTKDVEAFIEKVQRKGYSDPYEENEDFCGLRIAHFFPSDADQICAVIRKNFFVLRDPRDISPDSDVEFGYRAMHFIVKAPAKLLPQSRQCLAKLKAEIQVTSLLNHAWASVFHHGLGFYKRRDTLTPKLERKAKIVAAVLELCDEAFDEMKKEKAKASKEITKKAVSESAKKTEIAAPSFQEFKTFLDAKFPNQARSEGLAKRIHERVEDLSITLAQLWGTYEANKECLKRIAAPGWQQASWCNMLLCIYSHEYYDKYIGEFQPRRRKDIDSCRKPRP